MAQTLSTDGKVAVDTSFHDPIVLPVQIVGGAQSAVQGVVAPYSGNAAALTASTDYSFRWGGATPGQVVNHVLLQNNTAAVLNYDIDQPASAGTLALAANSAVMLDIRMAALHLFAAGTPTVNGAAAGGVVVRAWL